ncbi:hypothetical protein B9L19_13460 [Geobacillus thermocatenulatus]|uniref:Uncharacterized protein n=1 Tax=Geobacillus thermocatenulatus TaxID=33938 RepID=A0A226Q4U8_9BACL|nr:hypothetical protein GT3921_14590 [Geobacillus thermocatenulatus]KLR72313.1 hypothetical protein ABH20_16890 [Geobacillus sp. T6]OXB86532.1 hypothetical protein B9L19_13460 [Geobacillus thermocatenulatus]
MIVSISFGNRDAPFMFFFIIAKFFCSWRKDGKRKGGDGDRPFLQRKTFIRAKEFDLKKRTRGR